MSEDKDLELGFQIEKELDELYASGKREFEVDELEKIAPKTYDVLYDVCDSEDEHNGIETNKYRLIEVEGEENFIFKLTKK